MKELMKIIACPDEWGEVKDMWRQGDLRVAAAPLAWLAVALGGMLVAGW